MCYCGSPMVATLKVAIPKRMREMPAERIIEIYQNLPWDMTFLPTQLKFFWWNIISMYSCLVSQSCLTLWPPHGLEPARLFCWWDFPGKNNGVGYHFLPQGIFLTQGSIPHLLDLLHWQVDSLPLNHLGKPICIYYLYIWEAYICTCMCIHIYIIIVCLIAQSCLTLCYPLDCSPPDSSVHGILQTIILELGVISFSRGSSQKRAQTYVS